MITAITDHVDQGLSKLITRYKRKRRFAAWVAASIRQFQKLEDAAWGVINSRDVDTCDETRLEILGRIAGQPRKGETLAQFRLYVKARIAVNRSRGRIPDILRIARLLLGSIELWQGTPAYFRITKTDSLDPSTIDPNVAAGLLRDATAAGVGMSLVYGLTARPNRFAFGWTSGATTRGFGSTTGGATAGKIAAHA